MDATISILYKTENVGIKNFFGTRFLQGGTEDQVGQLQDKQSLLNCDWSGKSEFCISRHICD